MYKILLTVDDAIARKNFQDQLDLKLSGSEIIFADNTHEATSFLTQNPVSMVVLDLHSFQVDSLNILAFMTHEHPKTPCFILGDHTLLETDAKSALYHYVQKPYDLEEVTSEIAHIIRDDVLETTPKGMPVSTFMQLVSMEAKTCLLGVYPADEEERGLFYFEKGLLFDAVQSKLKGENAALKMLSISGAEIHLKDIQKKIGRKINTSLLALVEKLKEPGPRPWEKEPQQVEETTAAQPEAPSQAQPIPEPAPAPIPEPVEIDEELPLFPSSEEIVEEETVAEAQEASEATDTQEEPPILEPIEETPVEIATKEVAEEPSPTPTGKAETAPEEPEKPKTRDYFEETVAPQKAKEVEAGTPEKPVAEKAESKTEAAESAAEETKEEAVQAKDTQEKVVEDAPAQAVEEQPASDDPERPKTIDYFEKVEVQKPQQKSSAPATEEEPEKPETPTTETEAETSTEPLSEPTAIADSSPTEADDTEQPEQVEDIVSILEAEPGEFEEEFDDVVEEASADDILEEPEIIEDVEEQEEVVVLENPEPEPEILAEPLEEDVWEEPIETPEEAPEEISPEIAEETEDEEKVSNETMEEVVAPIESAIQEETPQLPSEIETDPKTLWDNNIGDLRDIRGYRAAAVLNFDGEVALFDSVDPNIQLNTIGATFNSLFWLSQDAFNRVGLKEFSELILSTPSGLVVMISSGKESPRQFHLLGILAEDGNQNLMRFKFGNLAQKLKNVPV